MGVWKQHNMKTKVGDVEEVYLLILWGFELQLKVFKTLLDYEQSLFFLSLSSQNWKIRK